MSTVRKLVIVVMVALALSLAVCTTTTAKPIGVVTGVAYACQGPRLPAGHVLHVRVSLYVGPKLVASETVRSAARYRFSVGPNAYRVTAWSGSKRLTLRAGHIVTANFDFPNTCI